jgi:anti-sigma factor RsiW
MSATFDHPGDLLSAYLDGELEPEQRADVEGHVATCDACRRELAGVETARRLVRDLGDVEVPDGYFEGLLAGGVAALEAPRLARPSAVDERRKRRFKFGVANLVATAAVWMLVIGLVNVGRNDDSVAASDVIAQSASLLPSFGGRSPAPASPTERAEAASYRVPASLAGTYHLAGFRVVAGQPQALYADGQRVLVMFVVPGQLDWHSLPQPRPVQVNGDPAWAVSTDDADLVLVQRPEGVVVLAGPPTATGPDLAGGLDPEVAVDDGILARLETACRNLLDTFGLQS